MKATFVCTLLLVMVAAPHANAASPAKRKSEARTASIHRTQPHRKQPVRVIVPATLEIKAATQLIADLKAEVPGVEKFLRDPRFHFDMRVITGPVPLVGYPPEWSNSHPAGNYMLSDVALRNCAALLENNAEQFDVIEGQFRNAKAAVSREAVAAILDAEHMCGAASLGTHPVAQTLFTLAAFRPRVVKRGWARAELITFFKLAQQYEFSEGMWRDPLAIMGSRRGAFGLTQDIPSAYAMTAMHFDGTHCISQLESPTAPDVFDVHDATCSIANYLSRTGRTGYASFIRYNHSRGYANSCVKVTARLHANQVTAHLRAATK